MSSPARIFLTIAAAFFVDLEAGAQGLEYRFSIVDEGTLTKLNLTTPLNYQNRILPQPVQGNDAISNLFLGYGGLSTSLNVSALANNLTAPDYNYSIRELSYDLSLSDNLDVTVGRKILKWGPGYAFNPTGVVEPQRSPSDPIRPARPERRAYAHLPERVLRQEFADIRLPERCSIPIRGLPLGRA